MNISRSRAVDTFKKYGIFWYHGAQKLPIDVYKDIILFHEFVENIAQIINTDYDNKEKLIVIVQEWHEAYISHNINHPMYGWFIEVMIRRRIWAEYIKAFLQSMLVNTTHISYKTQDEFEVYIYGACKAIWLVVSEIIGCAPAWQTYVHSLSEWLWLVHMLLDLHRDRASWKYYIPQVILDQHGVSSQDIMFAIHSYKPNDALYHLIKYYVDLHETLLTYAIKWMWYLNKQWHEWVLIMLSDYENVINTIKHYDYNVFHPRFRIGLWHSTLGRVIYWFWLLIWR